jgi:hypothetical protein
MLRSNRWAVVVLLAGGTMSSACTVTMYPGPKRPDAETAVIEPAGASIESIDWLQVPVGSRFVVLPGSHTVEVKVGSGEAVAVCFVARARHVYRVMVDGDRPVVRDDVDVTMRTYRLMAGEVCGRVMAQAEADRRAASARLAAQSASARDTVPAAPSEQPAAAAAQPETPASAESPPPPEPPAPLSPPRPFARSANDDDAPAAPRALDEEQPRKPHRPFRPGPRRIIYHDEPPDPPPRKPGLGLIFEWGMGGGGADLATVDYSDGTSATLSLGDGISVSVGLMWTPIWIGDDLGIGFSGTAGYKGWGVGASNGDVSINRFPLTLAVHVMPRVALRWFLFGRGGIDKEVGVSVSASGVAGNGSADLNANLGWFGEGGFYKIMDTEEQRWAWSLTFRYTDLTYTVGDGYGYASGSASARSFMIFNAFYYNP